VSTWTGFHRIEKALWQDKTLAGMAPVADRLTADLTKLRSLVENQSYQPAQIANGCVELLDEVAKSKVTGEEERYSHTDLYDFEANVLGAQEGFAVLKPLLRASDPQLADTIDARFADVLAALAKYRQGDGWVDYSTVSDSDRRVLAQKVDSLSEPLSEVAARVGRRIAPRLPHRRRRDRCGCRRRARRLHRRQAAYVVERVGRPLRRLVPRRASGRNRHPGARPARVRGVRRHQHERGRPAVDADDVDRGG
jgi:hypothetical protein